MLRHLPLIFVLLAVSTTAGATSATVTTEDCAVELLKHFNAGGHMKKADAAGFHGTSIEALQWAQKTGALAGGILPENQNGFYFFPNLAHPRVQVAFRTNVVKLGENVVPGDDADAVKDAWDGAVGYANRIAIEHRLLALLELPFTPQNQRAVAAYIADSSDRDIIEALIGKDGDRRELKNIYVEARKAKGVVLFIAPRVFDDMKVTNAAPEDDGLRIDTSTTHGLPLAGLLAIDPLGDDEYLWFSALRRELAK